MAEHCDLFGNTPRMDRSAVLSPCERYRYRLGRRWGDAPPAVFVMLNPSTADADNDDPTIRRCMGFARSWGAGGIVVVNLFARRATDPDVLVAAHRDGRCGGDAENDSHILRAIDGASMVIAAWGAKGSLGQRDRMVIELVRSAGVSLSCLRVTKGGYPEHPLYLPGSLTPQPYAGRP